MSHKMQAAITASNLNASHFLSDDRQEIEKYFEFEKIKTQSSDASKQHGYDEVSVEMRFPALPDLMDDEDLHDEEDGNQIYVNELIAEFESRQLND